MTQIYIKICDFGGMAINAAALDPRIKATVTSTIYDIAGVIPYDKMETFFKTNLN